SAPPANNATPHPPAAAPAPTPQTPPDPTADDPAPPPPAPPDQPPAQQTAAPPPPSPQNQPPYANTPSPPRLPRTGLLPWRPALAAGWTGRKAAHAAAAPVPEPLRPGRGSARLGRKPQY